MLRGRSTTSWPISQIVKKSFGTCLQNRLEEVSKRAKFSFAIDSSTIVNQNILGVRVRYFDTETYQIENKLWSIYTLQESSTSDVLYKILKEQLLKDPLIEDNIIAIVKGQVTLSL